jgi:hypothetical protein
LAQTASPSKICLQSGAGQYIAPGDSNVDSGGESRLPIDGAGTSMIPGVKSTTERFKVLPCPFNRKMRSVFQTKRAA